METVLSKLKAHIGGINPFHWQVAFPGVWEDWDAAERIGGFDAVIGNPPYVRQELLKDQKPALKETYPKTWHGSADLYVYFYEQGVRLLKPGGRLSYVVTNKWFRAAYAEKLRQFFAEETWLEFVADFGHAKHFFPDADVFPCVIVLRSPDDELGPEQSQICAIPREDVPEKYLDVAVRAATYLAPREQFTASTWTLESQPVMNLLAKLTARGTGLSEKVGSPNLGIKTGFNPAFLMTGSDRDALLEQDHRMTDILFPYLRGQDLSRWNSPLENQWMIALKSSANHPWPWAQEADEQKTEKIFASTFPALHRHMKKFESFPDPSTGLRKGLRHREDQGRFWWELRSCSYYTAFEAPKIIFPDIAWTPSFSIDKRGAYANNSAYILASSDQSILAVLNSPVIWWLAWRHVQHAKDEALRMFGTFMEQLPIPQFSDTERAIVSAKVDDICALTRRVHEQEAAFADWMKLTFDLVKLPTAMGQLAQRPESDAISTALTAFPKRSQPGATDLARIKKQVRETISPAHTDWLAIQSLERELSDHVNTAFGMTKEDVALMWATAPPRMPFKA